MKKNLQSLLSLLQQQYKLYNDLYYVLDEEYEHLSNSDTDAIRKVVDTKYKFIDKIDELEFKRVKLCEEIAKELNLNEEARLSVIAQYTDEDTAKTLLTWKGTFEALLTNIKEKNDINNMMASAALESVESTIDAMKDALQTTDVYQNKGSKKSGDQVEHLLSKKV
tara:strand:- start:4853 stop:5350 length:498 start_codon:yes stop_codon:yes gene_type:complete